MERRILFAATAACGILAGALPAAAGYWNYGCKGSLGDTAFIFDRNTFVIMPKALARGDLDGLIQGSTAAFDAKDNNSGFMPTMMFVSDTYPDQKIVLTEKSSKVTAETRGHLGTRQKSTVHFRKSYHYQRPAWPGVSEADISMECIEYMLTAP